MARKPNTLVVVSEPAINHEAIAEAHAAMNTLSVMNSEANENAHALAVRLGYEGALTVGALEDEIRFYQRQTAEACFELGKRLLVLKELTPHGEFEQRIELLGIERRAAQRFMAVSRKFSNATTSPLLKVVETQSKLLELLVLDDDEVSALESGETVRGIGLDDIEIMSVRELKAALRESKANLATKDDQIAAKNAKLDDLDAQLTKTKKRVAKEAPDAAAQALRSEASVEAHAAESAVTGCLRPVVAALVEHGREHNQSHDDFIAGLLCQIEAAIAGLRGEFQIKDKPDGDDLPEWMRPGFDSKAAAAGKAN